MITIFILFQSAILMALLATNYIHLCKETLWLFANIVNCESVIVQVAIALATLRGYVKKTSLI